MNLRIIPFVIVIVLLSCSTAVERKESNRLISESSMLIDTVSINGWDFIYAITNENGYSKLDYSKSGKKFSSDSTLYIDAISQGFRFIDINDSDGLVRFNFGFGMSSNFELGFCFSEKNTNLFLEKVVEIRVEGGEVKETILSNFPELDSRYLNELSTLNLFTSLRDTLGL